MKTFVFHILKFSTKFSMGELAGKSIFIMDFMGFATIVARISLMLRGYMWKWLTVTHSYVKVVCKWPLSKGIHLCR